jgi:hypothetical protein
MDIPCEAPVGRAWFEVKANSGTNPHDARRLEVMLDDIGAVRGYLIGLGAAAGQLSPRVSNIFLDLSPNWLPG